MSLRARMGLIGLLFVSGLVSLAILAPPDGKERGDLAQFLGAFHPLAVHLPIALLLLVPVLEIAGLSPRRGELHQSAGFVLGLGVMSAIAAPYLGWLLAWSGGFEGGLVTQHLWGGITVASLALLAWFLRGRALAQPRQRRFPTYAAMLSLLVLAVAFTGYRGGQLAHGEDHLSEHLPALAKIWLGMSNVESTVPHDRASFYAARIEPIFEQHCLVCHNANKRKGGLRLDSFEGLKRGGKDGQVVLAGNARGSEIFRRVSLNPSHKDFMPAEGKPPLGQDERKLLELWINAGASPTIAIDAIAGAHEMKKPDEPWAPDYRGQQALIAQLEADLEIALVPRSQDPTDGVILRTASNPTGCDDGLLEKLAPVARYIVDAELARTHVTDAGLLVLASFANLRRIDLSHTAITSSGLRVLRGLPKLEVLNLTGTVVDDAGASALRVGGTLKHLYIFRTKSPAAAGTLRTGSTMPSHVQGKQERSTRADSPRR